MDRRRRCDGWRSRRWRCDTWRDGRCDGFTLEFDFANAADPSLDRTAVLVLDPATNTIAARTLTTGATTAGLDLLRLKHDLERSGGEQVGNHSL